MKEFLDLSLSCAVAILVSACAGVQTSAGYDLRFGSDHTFRILQMTDVHLKGEDRNSYDLAKSQMISAVDREHPDLVVFTGDVVTTVPAREWWEDFFRPLDERNVPFVVVYGNHDRERELSEYELAKVLTAHPANVNELDEYGLLSDMALKVTSSDGSRVGAVLYCFDSFDYPSVAGFSGYGWIAGERIEWYRHTSAALTSANDGYPIPSYAFFHIPLPEYAVAYERGFAIDGGKRGEKECSAVLNSGMFTTMLECGDVHGVFVGHDHTNDYIAPYGGIALAYGRVSGFFTTYGTEDQPHGLRVIDIMEGDFGFDTFVSLNGGGSMAQVNFRDSTDFSVHPAVSAGTPLAGGERFLEVPQNGHWTFRKTRGRGYEVAIDDVIVCPGGNRTTGVIALEKGLHKIRVTPVTDNAGDEPFHLAWRRAGSSIMREIPEDKYVNQR